MQGFPSQISWETEVWIADSPSHRYQTTITP